MVLAEPADTMAPQDDVQAHSRLRATEQAVLVPREARADLEVLPDARLLAAAGEDESAAEEALEAAAPGDADTFKNQ